jgi:hypothetical protein
MRFKEGLTVKSSKGICFDTICKDWREILLLVLITRLHMTRLRLTRARLIGLLLRMTRARVIGMLTLISWKIWALIAMLIW